MHTFQTVKDTDWMDEVAGRAGGWADVQIGGRVGDKAGRRTDGQTGGRAVGRSDGPYVTDRELTADAWVGTSLAVG